MLIPRVRCRNVRADVPDILQQSLRNGEVVGRWAQTGHVAVLCGWGVVGSDLSILDSSTLFRLSDPWRALAPLVSGGPVATGDRAGVGPPLSLRGARGNRGSVIKWLPFRSCC